MQHVNLWDHLVRHLTTTEFLSPAVRLSTMSRCLAKSHNASQLSSCNLEECATGNPEVPPPEAHGWLITDDHIEIDWMSLPPAPEALMELILCGCTGNCTIGNCTCKRNGLSCSNCCQCGERCNNSHNYNLEESKESKDDDDDGE